MVGQRGAGSEGAGRSRRRFWCGDECMRGVVLPRLFRSSGFEVLAPPVKGCRPGRLQYLHHDAARMLEERGCPELSRINREYCVKPRARGDVDFAARRDGVLLIGEVKTRMLVKYHGRGYLRDLIVYHLAEPGAARNAWDRLERLGVVKRPSCRGPSGRDYDNPASIAELTRSIIGFCVKNPAVCEEAETVIAAALTVCYARPYAAIMLDAVRSTASYLEKCLGRRVEPLVAIVEPSPSVYTSGVLDEVSVSCIGEGCRLMGAVGPLKDPLGECREQCETCTGCRYASICSVLCAEGA